MLRGKDGYGEFAVYELCDPYLSASVVDWGIACLLAA